MIETKRRALILATLGERDVTLYGEEKRPAREKGEEILGGDYETETDHYKELSDHIDLPILRAGLSRIGELGYLYPEVLGRQKQGPDICLFYTDQEDERYSNRDTVAFAEIAKRKLPQMFPEPKEGEPGLHVRSQKAIGKEKLPEEPNRYDRMYRFFEKFFRTNRQAAEHEKWLCFVLASGGTPAMVSMLLIHAIQHFGAGCVQIYVPDEGEVSEMMIGEDVIRASAQRRFNEALDALQFQAAASIADEELHGGGGRSAAARYAEYRLAFDFRRAEEHCRSAMLQIEASLTSLTNRLSAHRDTLRRLRVELDAAGNVAHAKQPPLIAEVFYNLELKYESGEFVDVLGRCFRLQEALLTWIVEENTPINASQGKSLSSQRTAVQAMPGLEEYLKSYKVEDNVSLDRSRPLDSTGLRAVADYLLTPDSGLAEDARARVRGARDAAKNIQELARLRNKTIIAHGFRGVSKEELIAEYDGRDTLVEDLRRDVGRALGMDLSNNPFRELSWLLRF